MKIALNAAPSDKKRQQTSRFLFFFKVLSILFILILVLITSSKSFDFFSYLKLKGIQGPAFRSNPSAYVSAILTHTPKSLLSRSEIKNLNIDIKFDDWQTLMKYKEESINNGMIGDAEKIYLKGSISYDGNNVPAKLRLKGDWTDHLLGKKLSLRFKLEDDNFISGMNKFSIQSPTTRDFQGQLIIDKMLGEFNIITPRNFLVRTKINGNDIGLMFLSEHFSKELLENSKRKESVIIKFDETELWKSRLNNKIYEADEFSAKITAFGMDRVMNDERLYDDYTTATGLLRGFLSQRMMAHDVFDVKKMGDFLAINDLWGESHGLIWHNLRFYFNPISVKLEPIGFDQMLYHTPETLDMPIDSIASSKFIDKIRNNGFIKLVYIETLKELKNNLQDPDYFNDYVDFDNSNEKILRKEFFLKPPPLLQNNNLLSRLDSLITNATDSVIHMKSFRGNLAWAVNPRNHSKVVDLIYGVNVIKANMFNGDFYKYGLSNLGLENANHGYILEKNSNQKLNIMPNNNFYYVVEDNPDLQKFQKIANIYSHANDSTVSFEIENLIPIPIEINKIKVMFKEEKKIIPRSIYLDGFDTILQSYAKENIEIDNINYEDVENIFISINAVGDIQNYTFLAENYPKALTTSPIPKSTLLRDIDKHSYLQVDNERKTIDTLSGEWSVELPIIIPAGYTFNISENTTLKFNKESFILSLGQINFQGSTNKPIILKPQNGIKSWKGIKIIGNSELPLSTINNVSIVDTSALFQNGWRTDAGFFAYKVSLESNNLKIINNKSEDAINLVNSHFNITNISINNSYSDGLDVDFSTGIISGGSFNSIGKLTGGDALDFSGSIAKIYDLSISNVDDKGLSIGEKSSIYAENIDILETSIGVAIKDASSLEMVNSSISKSDNGVLAYIKKSEYAPPQARFENIDFNLNILDYKSHDGSRIIINNKLIQRDNLSVDLAK